MMSSSGQPHSCCTVGTLGADQAAMAAAVPGAGSYAWALGVQPHVTIMELSLHGVAQIETPYAIDDVIFPGTFTVDAGALTLVTLFTK